MWLSQHQAVRHVRALARTSCTGKTLYCGPPQQSSWVFDSKQSLKHEHAMEQDGGSLGSSPSGQEEGKSPQRTRSSTRSRVSAQAG